MVGPRSRSARCTASSSATSVRVQSASTSATDTSSAMANVRSTSEKRSPPSTASEPTAAPATERSSSSASRSTRSRTASRCSTVNTSASLWLALCPEAWRHRQHRPRLLLSTLDLGEAVTHEFLEREFGDRLIGREANGPLCQLETDELIADGVDRRGAERKHAEVVLARSYAEQRALLVLERRHPVARRLFRVWHGAPNELSYALEFRALRPGNSRKVLVERRHTLTER